MGAGRKGQIEVGDGRMDKKVRDENDLKVRYGPFQVSQFIKLNFTVSVFIYKDIAIYKDSLISIDISPYSHKVNMVMDLRAQTTNEPCHHMTDVHSSCCMLHTKVAILVMILIYGD